MGYHLGVDLGTTFSAAAAMSDGPPTMIGLGNRALQIPSVLYFLPDGGVLVGEAAEHRSGSDPSRTVREFKRRIGDPVPILVAGRPFSAQALSGRLLRWVVDKSAEQMGERPVDITLTYPANWGHFKIDLLRQVAMLADVDSVRACSEPEAAALQYASRSRVNVGDRIAVYDLGGGTFDVCVLEKTETGFQVPGRPDGIEHLGGIDFDEAIFQRVISQLPPDVVEAAIDDATQMPALARLRRDCVEAKEALSTDVDAVIPVALAGARTSIRLTRGEFEDIIRPALEDTVGATRRALRSAETDAAQLTAIVLVGGSSRIPLVAEMLGSEFRRPIAVDTHPKNDVAMGAARAGALQDAGILLTAPSRRRAPAPAVAPAAVVASPTTSPDQPITSDQIGPANTWPAPASERPIPSPTGPHPVADPPTQRQTADAGAANHGAGFAAPSADETPTTISPVPPRRADTDDRSGSPPDRRKLRVVLIAAAVAVLLAGIGTFTVLSLNNNTVAGSAVGSSGSTTDTATSASDPSETDSASPVSSAVSTQPVSSAPAVPAALPTSAPLADDQLLLLKNVQLSDGSKGQHIFLAQVGNPEPVKDLTPGDISVSGIGLTPDRRTMSFLQSGDPTGVIRVAGTDGGQSRPLFTVEHLPKGCEEKIYRPAWNPADPTQFAAVCRPSSGPHTLNLFSTDGHIIHELDTGQEKFDDVAFDRDGKRVIYQAEGTNNWDGGAIYGLDVSGQQPAVALTQPTMLGQDADPVVSPDGTTIAFRRRVVEADGDRNFDLWLMNADGSNQRALTTGAPDDQDPSWSPDGKTIAFKSDRSDAQNGVGSGERIWLVSVEDGHIEPLWGDAVPDDQATPAWSNR